MTNKEKRERAQFKIEIIREIAQLIGDTKIDYDQHGFSEPVINGEETLDNIRRNLDDYAKKLEKENAQPKDLM